MHLRSANLLQFINDTKRRYNGLVKQSKFRVGLIQMACSLDPNENLAKAEWRIREAAAQGRADHLRAGTLPLAVFLPDRRPRHVRPCRDHSGPDDGELYADWPRELNVVIVGSIFERRMAGVYHNTAVVIDADGALLGLYRKMHIPDDPRFYEKYYFTPGDLGFRCFDTRYARIAPLICWDQWYPEGARLAALGGAQILFYPTAIGWHQSDAAEAGTQHDAWETIQRSHAIANGVYVAAVNRVGHEGPAGRRPANSGAARSCRDPLGRMLAKARRSRRDSDCGMRPARDRRGAPQLALPARPPHRRLRTDREPGDRLKARTPRARGFRMPAEWEPHEATWIAWPHNRDDWPGTLRADPVGVRRDRAQTRRRGARPHPGAERGARSAGAPHSRRRWARTWMRWSSSSARPTASGRATTARLFVKNRRGEIALTAWRFNAWAKYDDWRKTPRSPHSSAKRLKLPVFTPEMVLEGGSIDVNGAGTAADHRGVPAESRAGAQSRT